ncbi:nuclear transcription factor Y, gamma [Pancytospora philotis]|nr:nuclear transcription factor Y, gamma [Pancytospora philotis]
MSEYFSQKLASFWHNAFMKASSSKIKLKELNLPLARIKRLMKVEENVRMVASEVPILFSLVAEAFIEELTLRAWLNTDDSKRRILQKTDISAAVKTSQMYDFLTDIISSNSLIHLDSQDEDELAQQQVYLESNGKNINYGNNF